ncbi:MAG: FctA domain-containing protein, partial [Erysipelotrichaceae bacterium]|nr:FctA domain-containing protein [Erysipelotrichaceae bacterium]
MFRKNIKPVVLAGALALATAVSPVFAAEDTKSIDVTKTAEFADGFNTVNGEFSFTVTPYSYYTYKNSDGSTDEEFYKKDTNGEKLDSVFPSHTITDIDINYDVNGTNQSKSGNGTLTFKKNTNTIPGVYIYTVQENTGTDANWTYDDTTYYVYVTVEDDGTVGITQIKAKKGNTSLPEKDKLTAINFTNQYTENATFEVGKTVTGKYGDKTKDFAFSIEFKKAAQALNTEIVGTVYNGDDATNTTYTFEYGQVQTVNLKDGQTIKFNTIPVGTTYYVTETVAGDDGYSSSYVQTSNNAQGKSTSASKD